MSMLFVSVNCWSSSSLPGDVMLLMLTWHIVRVLALCVSLLSVADVSCSERGCWCDVVTGSTAAAAETAGTSAAAGTSLE